jgi:hypothetical protein
VRSLAAVAVGATGLGLLLAGPSVTPWAFATGGGLVAGLVLLRRAGRPDLVGRALAALLATAVVALSPFDGGAYLLPAALTSLVLEMRPVEGAGEPREVTLGDGPADTTEERTR